MGLNEEGTPPTPVKTYEEFEKLHSFIFNNHFTGILTLKYLDMLVSYFAS